MRPYKFLLLLLFVCSIATPSKGQQLEIPTLYRYNWQLLNPASIDYVYLKDKQKRSLINISGRTQWLGSNFPDAPSSLHLRYERNPSLYRGDTGMKFGGFAIVNSAGPLETIRLQANMAGMIHVNANSIISVGLNAGIIQHRLDTESIYFKDNSILPEGNYVTNALDVGAGIFYIFDSYDPGCRCENFINTFYIGLSIPRVGDVRTFNLLSGQPYIKLAPHAYFILGATTPIFANGSFIELSTWVKRVQNTTFQTLNYAPSKATTSFYPLSIDVNLRAQYKNIAWLGVGYSTQKMLHTEAGFTFSDQKLLYNGFFIANVGLAFSFPTAWDNSLGSAAEVSLTIGLNGD